MSRKILGKYILSCLLTVTGVMASQVVSNLPQDNIDVHCKKTYENSTVFLDRSNISKFEILKPETYGLKSYKNSSIIPTPNFDLKDCDLKRMMPEKQKGEFSEILSSGKHFVFHGIGLGSVYRLLDCYYEGVDKLSPTEVFNLAAWSILNLRTVISTSLVYEGDPKTWYPIGFVLEVPLPDLVYKVSQTDACILMEGTKNSPFGNAFHFNQKTVIDHYNTKNDPPLSLEHFAEYKKELVKRSTDDDYFDRDAFLEEFSKEKGYKTTYGFGPKSSGELSYLTQIIEDTMNPKWQGSNEIAIFHGVKNQKGQDFNVKIKGIVLTSSGKYGPQSDKIKNCPSDLGYYEDLAISFAKKLSLPVVDLRKTK